MHWGEGGRGDYLVFDCITQGCRHDSLGCSRWMEGGRRDRLSTFSACAKVQILACHLVGAKPLSELRLNIVNWDIRTIFSEVLGEIHKFIQGNAFENVVRKMPAFFSRPQCVKLPWGTSPRAGVFTSTGLSSLSPPETVSVTASGWARGGLIAGVLIPRFGCS